MNSQAIDFINQKYGSMISKAYYSQIDDWLSWWKGYNQPFHRYSFNNGKKLIKRDYYTLKMGKKVCEDWASILLNDKTHCIISDEKASEYVQGKMENGGVFGSNNFWTKGNSLIEMAFATGTGAVAIHIENAMVREDGTFTGDKDTRIRLCYLSADYIIPISCDHGRITEAAFISEHIRRGRKYLLIEVHILEKGKYVIHNHWFSVDNDTLKEAPRPEGVAESLNTGSAMPWFAIVSPNIENNIKDNGGLGISVLHNAIDILKGVDLAYNNLCKDFELGGKKVFMVKSMMEEMDDGTAVAPDDVGQQLFMTVPADSIDSANTNGGKFIQEFNPIIRAEENTKGVQANLDYLSFRCGLGNKHYQFNSSGVVTATQYTGDKQDLLQNAHKHYLPVEAFLKTLIQAIIHVGNMCCSWGVPDDTKIDIVFDKSVVIDEASERLQDRQDMIDGIMPKWEYRKKWYGETEKQARAVIEEISGDTEMYGGDFE